MEKGRLCKEVSKHYLVAFVLPELIFRRTRSAQSASNRSFTAGSTEIASNRAIAAAAAIGVWGPGADQSIFTSERFGFFGMALLWLVRCAAQRGNATRFDTLCAVGEYLEPDSRGQLERIHCRGDHDA